jgi:hypothetical protein
VHLLRRQCSQAPGSQTISAMAGEQPVAAGTPPVRASAALGRIGLVAGVSGDARGVASITSWPGLCLNPARLHSGNAAPPPAATV